MAKKILIGVTVLLVVVLAVAVFRVAAPPTSPPEQQIADTLAKAATDYNTGRVWQAFSILSPAYKDSTGLTRDQLRTLLARARVEAPDQVVTIRHLDAAVTGDEALVPLTVQVGNPRTGAPRDYTVTVRMKREDATAYGVIPVKRWRVTYVENMPAFEMGGL